MGDEGRGGLASSSRSLRFSASSTVYTSPESASPVGWGGGPLGPVLPTPPPHAEMGARSKSPSPSCPGMGDRGLRTSSDPPPQTIPWCKPSEGDAHQWSPAAVYGWPPRGSPSPLAPTRQLLSASACPSKLILQHPLHRLNHLRERAEPSPRHQGTGTAQCKAVVAITSPPAPGSARGGVEQAKGSHLLQRASCPSTCPSHPQPRAPQLTFSCCCTVSSKTFLLATFSWHLLSVACCCWWARWSSTRSFSRSFFWGRRKGKAPQGPPCRASSLGASLVGLGEPYGGGPGALRHLLGYGGAVMLSLLPPCSFAPTPSLGQPLPAPAGIRTRISSFCSCWTRSFSLLISAVLATSLRLRVAARARATSLAPARGWCHPPPLREGEGSPNFHSSAFPITHQACPEAPPGS